MCVAGMKRGPCPTILYSFFTKLNEEALLKVSLKNLHLFQSYPFFKNTAFSKMALKIYQKLKNLIFFCIHGNHFYMGFQWYIACFDTFNIPWEIEAFTAVKFHSSPTVCSGGHFCFNKTYFSYKMPIFTRAWHKVKVLPLQILSCTK